MSDRVRIPFCEDIEAKIVEYAENPGLAARAWWGWHSSYGVKQAYGADRVVMTICPDCRTGSGILTRHTISADGEVNASILCPGKCGGKWHIFGILDGYAEHGGKPQLVPLKA